MFDSRVAGLKKDLENWKPLFRKLEDNKLKPVLKIRF
jgi:hypothetical protein